MQTLTKEASEESPLVLKHDGSDNSMPSALPPRHTSVTDSTSSNFVVAVDTVKLAVPIFVSRLSWVAMKTTDSALLGHVNAESLAAASLSDLYTMSTLVLVQGRILGVFVGQSVGANNPRLAGIYLQASLILLGSLSLLVVLAWLFTEHVWILLGQTPNISSMAGYYATILAISIPGQVFFSQLSQFFSAQRIMHPEVIASSIAMVLNLIFGLVFVLGIGLPIPNFHGFGFVACPIVTMSVVYAQIFFMWFVYCWVQGLHRPCWGGWSFIEAVERIPAYSKLYFPAALTSASDYWRVAVIGYIAAHLGEREVAIFNTSYRIMWIVLTMVGALSGAGGIKISLLLGEGNPLAAKQASNVAIFLCSVFLMGFAVVSSSYARLFGMIFTNDEEFLDLWEECWFPFIATLCFMNLAVALERVLYSLGRTAAVFRMSLISSWLGESVLAGIVQCTLLLIPNRGNLHHRQQDKFPG